jgi:hypothetical protein
LALLSPEVGACLFLLQCYKLAARFPVLTFVCFLFFEINAEHCTFVVHMMVGDLQSIFFI